HLGSEFYGDFGAFDVRLTLPGNFLVVHTGTLVNAAEVLPDSILRRLQAPGDAAVTIWDRSRFTLPSDSTGRRALTLPKTWVIHADSVHDFAWACDEKWIWRRARWNGIDIHTYHRSADAKRWLEMADEGARMMEFMTRRFGPYSYPSFSFVEEPIAAGGVEFPNIVWITPRRGATASRRLEYLFAHELAHNWFYGMVGSNETAQAFLDEGLTSYAETATMEALYGRTGNLTEVRKPRWLYPRDDSRSSAWRSYLEFQGSGIEEPVVTHSDRFKNPAAYYPSVYHKSNIGLWTLRSIAGEERFDEAMREYFATWRYHHPYAEDFFASMNHALGASYDWFWRGWFQRTDAIDLKLLGLDVMPDSARAEIRIASRGGIDPPVPVRFRDGKGHEVRRVVPREAFLPDPTEAVYRVRLPFVPTYAELDPDLTLPDLDWSDNRMGGWPRLQWMPDNWRASPRPIGKTLVLWRPDVWYQSDAGVQAGLAFDASTIRWEHALSGTAGVEARERRAYGDFEARFRSVATDPRRVLRARGYDMDGHRGFRLSIAQELGSKIERGYRSALTLAVDEDRLYDRADPRRPAEWSDGAFGNLEATVTSKRKFHRVQWTGSLRVRTDLLTRRASYGSILGTTTAEVTAVPKLPIQLRAVAGRVRGDAIPPEERFYLAGAGPRGEWASRWFRSRGTIPTRWTAALGGDGN
ncbi:MAG TPA: M1 family metallopeptidase, partial [Candidatus Saccharimonadales bacterium]|nr:M1 family metallopeptidase [Candidatus Saccharimonadales bacterium]